jgi:hypothetical protein
MPSTEKTHTIFEYQYRDASNYKAYGVLLLRGISNEEQQAALERCCEGAEYFVAEQLNIPALPPRLWTEGCGPNEDDHAWHEFIGLRAPSTGEQTDLKEWGTLADLVKQFEAVKKWDLSLSPNA